jgi:hypothetical protein
LDKREEVNRFINNLAHNTALKVPFATTEFPEKLRVIKKALQIAFDFGHQEAELKEKTILRKFLKFINPNS